MLAKPGVVRTIYDPRAGTGGILVCGGRIYLTEHNPQARLTMFGQELNPESYAICKADITCLTPDLVADDALTVFTGRLCIVRIGVVRPHVAADISLLSSEFLRNSRTGRWSVLL